MNLIGARVGLWNTALNFLSPGPRSDVTDHLDMRVLSHTFLVFDKLLLSVCISDETLLLVFDALLLGVWKSDETLILVFDIKLIQ